MITDDDRAIYERLAVVETKVDEIENEQRDFRAETRKAFDGVNGRLLGFALSVAASSVVISVTVFLTR